MDKERRTLQIKIEIRKVENDNGELPYIEGYALKFGTRSENMGGFVEMLSKNCLDNTDMNNVVALYNHDESYPLARNTVPLGAGSLELKVDDTGLYFRLTPTETTYAKDLITNLDAGVVGQCSFAFSLAPSGMKMIRYTFEQLRRSNAYGMFRLLRHRHIQIQKQIRQNVIWKSSKGLNKMN